MFDQDVLSTTAIPNAMLPPKRNWKEPLVDFEQGGVALQDASQGLQVQTWRAEYRDGGVYLSADSVAETLIYSLDDITEISLAFDQNMNWALAYMVDGFDARLRWFDTTLSQYATIELPDGSYDLRITLDDKREMQTASSDIILTYLRDGNLYFRKQRDRFLVEYQLTTGLASNQTISQFGMNIGWRLQWELRWVQPLKTPTIIKTSPPFLYTTETDTELIVFGTGFSQSTRFYVEDARVTSTTVSETEARITVPDDNLIPIGVGYTLDIQARTPKPGGGSSNTFVLTVRDLTSFRLTEDNNIRITEDGDFRVFEQPQMRLFENGIDIRITEDGYVRIGEQT